MANERLLREIMRWYSHYLKYQNVKTMLKGVTYSCNVTKGQGGILSPRCRIWPLMPFSTSSILP